MLKNKTLLCLGAFIFTSLACPAFAETDTANTTAVVPVKELIKTDTTVGTGTEAVAGKSVSVHYTGWLYSSRKPDHKGAQFDSSLQSGQPFTFPLGAGRVIKGWDQGVVGMKTGGKRTLIIPSDMAYGARGAGRGTIPPNAALVFDVELLSVQ